MPGMTSSLSLLADAVQRLEGVGGERVHTHSPLCFQSNTFQLVVASSSASSYAILLYPRDGLQFLSTPLGGRSVALEAGFNQGQQKSWWGYVSPGEYYRLTTEEESSVSALAQYVTSASIPGNLGQRVPEQGTSPAPHQHVNHEGELIVRKAQNTFSWA